MSSTASRLSAEMQISTSLEVLASAIFLGVNCLGKHHAGGGPVAELLVLLGADGLIEGGGAGEIADRQIDEDQFGHGRLLFGGFRLKDERAGADPTADLDFFGKLSFRGDARHRTRNLEIPGLVLRTIPE